MENVNGRLLIGLVLGSWGVVVLLYFWLRLIINQLVSGNLLNVFLLISPLLITYITIKLIQYKSKGGENYTVTRSES